MQGPRTLGYRVWTVFCLKTREHCDSEAVWLSVNVAFHWGMKLETTCFPYFSPLDTAQLPECVVTPCVSLSASQEVELQVLFGASQVSSECA